MNKIKNFDQLATSSLRRQALNIMEAGLEAIDTAAVIKQNIKIKDQTMIVSGQSFDLTKFKHIKVIGFGKVSCRAALALEEVLGKLIYSGIAIGLAPTACKIIQTYEGTHPQPSYHNVDISQQIFETSKNSTAEDLVIVVVSGGGSALLCWPKTECDQGQMLYHQFLKTGGTIKELNTIRKHISLLKGGGLAKLLYPATVVGLIFSDVPGDQLDLIASGPTYLDSSTVADAQNIIKKYGLSQFDLIETPKDPKYFERVFNIVLATNKVALQAMQKKAQEFGFRTSIASDQAYDEPVQVLEMMKEKLNSNNAILAGGEPHLKVKNKGSGGRNLNVDMQALARIEDNECFIAFASDGLDNSDAAGAIVDAQTKQKTKDLGIDIATALENFDGYTTFQKLDELIFTGSTESNVSDLFLWLKQ